MSIEVSEIMERPIPNSHRSEVTRKLGQLEVGQCFEVSGMDRHRLSSAVHFVGKRDGKKFKTRTLSGGVVGIWRTA